MRGQQSAPLPQAKPPVPSGQQRLPRGPWHLSPHVEQWSRVPSWISQPVAKSPSQSAQPGSQSTMAQAAAAQVTSATFAPAVQLRPQVPQLPTLVAVSVSQPLAYMESQFR
tara:strand:- start:381 stop:713 length:333 start_codon:yes stop_codon:yes gene_type:complete